jgi:CheY-like chemotaxis protein
MEPEPGQAPEPAAATSVEFAPVPPPVAAPAPPSAPAAEAPPAQPIAPEPEAPPMSAPAAEEVPARSALVAEDSITARYFLTRLLEQRGFAVRGVSSAAEVARATERFGVVFADVELPDQRGAAYLAPLVERMREAGASVVALVRDAADSEAARAAGVVHVLRKPFEADALDRLLVRLGLSERAR